MKLLEKEGPRFSFKNPSISVSDSQITTAVHHVSPVKYRRWMASESPKPYAGIFNHTDTSDAGVTLVYTAVQQATATGC
ncbi:unnamed protein product, partial [Mesorhabditis spiculigera]